MINEALNQRLEGTLDILLGAHKGGSGVSNATKGFEREIFIYHFLKRIFPPQFRFGTGDIIDQYGNQSGQVDIVVEFPFLPSFPLSSEDSPRIYLAEGVAAVIEVKSNIQSEWRSVLLKAGKIKKIKRQAETIQRGESYEGSFPEIPFFVVGYYGWANYETLKTRVCSNTISGILQIDHKWFYAASIDSYRGESNKVDTSENDCLMGLIHCLHAIINNVRSIGFSPIKYCGEKS